MAAVGISGGNVMTPGRSSGSVKGPPSATRRQIELGHVAQDDEPARVLVFVEELGQTLAQDVEGGTFTRHVGGARGPTQQALAIERLLMGEGLEDWRREQAIVFDHSLVDVAPLGGM